MQDSSVLELKDVVVACCLILETSQVKGLTDLVACEQIGQKEGSELQLVLIRPENILVVDEVSSEEQEQRLKVHDLRLIKGFCNTVLRIRVHLELLIYN